MLDKLKLLRLINLFEGSKKVSNYFLFPFKHGFHHQLTEKSIRFY